MKGLKTLLVAISRCNLEDGFSMQVDEEGDDLLESKPAR